MISIKTALQAGSKALVNSESSQLDAELLLAFVLKKTREYLYTWPEKMLNQSEYEHYQHYCQSRCKGQPIAYLIEQRSFWDLDLMVNSNVLIPRPDTELLVEVALDKIDLGANLIADLGTGSGAIALVLAKERNNCKVLACDISEAALEVAKLNAEKLNLTNISFKSGAWCEAFDEVGLTAIISNPPYIAKGDEHLSAGDVRFEPEIALVSADQGLADLKIIAEQSLKKLRHGGWLMLEHGYQQAEAVQTILSENGYNQITGYKDLAGNDRVTCGCLHAGGSQ